MNRTMLTMTAMGTGITRAMNSRANPWISNLGTLSLSAKKAYSLAKLEQLLLHDKTNDNLAPMWHDNKRQDKQHFAVFSYIYIYQDERPAKARPIGLLLQDRKSVTWTKSELGHPRVHCDVSSGHLRTIILLLSVCVCMCGIYRCTICRIMQAAIYTWMNGTQPKKKERRNVILRQRTNQKTQLQH